MATTNVATIDVINPATGESIGAVPNMTADDVDEAVERAKQALPEWLDATPKERSELLYKLAQIIDDNAEELAQIESRNVGKPLMVSRDEMPFSADNLRFFAGAARVLEGKSAGEYVKGYTSLLLNRWERLKDEQKRMMLEQVNHDADRVTRLYAVGIPEFKRARAAATRRSS